MHLLLSQLCKIIYTHILPHDNILNPSTGEAETRALKFEVRPNQVLGLLISICLFPSWPLLCWDFSQFLWYPGPYW